jgi:hypothetical protein
MTTWTEIQTIERSVAGAAQYLIEFTAAGWLARALQLGWDVSAVPAIWINMDSSGSS